MSSSNQNHPKLPSKTPITLPTLSKLEKALIEKHGESQRQRIMTGLNQVASRWRESDGGEKGFEQFVMKYYISDKKALDDTFQHLEYALEILDGHANEVSRELGRFQTLDEGPLRPIDALLAAYSPKAHIQEDLFKVKVAFTALLNFPLTTLAERLEKGKSWNRMTWAQARLTERFEHRVPPDLLQHINEVKTSVEAYIDAYNILMDHVVLPNKHLSFSKGLKLISHWGLRDEIRGLYDQPQGLEKQRVIARIMERIIRQEIPQAVVNRPDVEWDPMSNKVRHSPSQEWTDEKREPDRRYENFLKIFHALRALDAYYPDAPTHIDRIFSYEREIPEERVRQMLISILSSDVAKDIGKLVSRRLGRTLEPFDIWYPGFRAKASMSEPELDAVTQKRYPNAQAFEKDIPNLLKRLGFDAETARFLSEHIVVDPARGAGHAMGARRRDDKAHLRTRIGQGGMNYKGYNIAIHEMGHNVEQVFSMSRIDHTLLEGVPNTGFTEAFAFLFQAQDLDLLKAAKPDPLADALHTLDRFWAAFEISGVALLDMDIWRWMYEHPKATPQELRQAALDLSKSIWNTYFAPVLGVKDQVLLAIYSHIIAFSLYTPDYPLGTIITFQIEQYMKGKNLGKEMERMCRLGRIAPDVWMAQAVGTPVSTQPLLEATKAAYQKVAKQ